MYGHLTILAHGESYPTLANLPRGSQQTGDTLFDSCQTGFASFKTLWKPTTRWSLAAGEGVYTPQTTIPLSNHLALSEKSI